MGIIIEGLLYGITAIVLIMIIQMVKTMIKQYMFYQKMIYSFNEYSERRSELLPIWILLIFVVVSNMIMYKLSMGNEFELNLEAENAISLLIITLYIVIRIIFTVKMKVIFMENGIAINGRRISWGAIVSINIRNNNIVVAYEPKTVLRKYKYKFMVIDYKDEAYEFLKKKVLDL